MKIPESHIAKLSNFIRENDDFGHTWDPFSRQDLEPYLKDLFNLNPVDFLVYNWNRFASVYCTHLMLCLPELLESLNSSQLKKICNYIDHDFGVVEFAGTLHKFWSINLFQEVFSIRYLPQKQYESRLNYAKEYHGSYFLEDEDIESLSERQFGIGWDDLRTGKILLSSDSEIPKAFHTPIDLSNYLNGLPDKAP